MIPPRTSQRRREFITLLGGAAVAPALWPPLLRAQQTGQVWRIGIMISYAEGDPEAAERIKAFRKGLEELGWFEGRNIRFDYRWLAGGNADRMRALAAELVALAPDVIVTSGTPITLAVQRETRTIPIVFGPVIDPVGTGLVASLARPEANITGFTNYELTFGGKWLELLKEVAPRLKRVLIIHYPENPATAGLLREIESLKRSLGLETVPAAVRNVGEIEHAIDTFARDTGGGLLVPPDGRINSYRGAIIARAARHRLPAIYSIRGFAIDGGLMSYGINTSEIYRRMAQYVDRLLKGAKPAELPVQQPTKFELVINLKTAKTLGLTIPAKLFFTADEVIE